MATVGRDDGLRGRRRDGAPPLRVAVVGGGVAGLVAAHALALRHDVTVLEAAPTAGGHVRTTVLPDGTAVDTGVVLYERRNFPVTHALLAGLGIAVREVPGATALYLDDDRRWLSPAGWSATGRRPGPKEALTLNRLRRRGAAFLRRVRGAALQGTSVGDWLVDDDLSEWLRMLLLYAYSTPREEVDGLAAELAVPMLVAFADARQWNAVVGGSQRLVAALADGLGRPVRAGCTVTAVTRDAAGVTVEVDGTRERFDQVVLAAGPDRVLALLADADDVERRRFGAWRGRSVETVVHRDDGPWRRRGVDYRSEFDLFRTPGGGHGYSACLNRIAGLADGPPWLGLSFGLREELDPASILHVQSHHVAVYDTAALAHREEVRATNGSRRTWHAGAWLGDGLQEGAVTAGLAVAEALGCPARW